MADPNSEEDLAALGANWAQNSNKTTKIKLWRVSERGDTPHCDHTFHPSFTYPIFGEEETIFGYKDLHLDLNFAAHDLRLKVDVRYSKKFPPLGEIEAFDIPKALEPFVPTDVFASRKEFLAALGSDEAAVAFTPPGKVIHHYTISSDKYEVWCSNLADSRANQLVRNVQVLMPMFIEGATVINLDDADENVFRRWKLYLLYHIIPSKGGGQNVSKYSLVGYSTSYRLWYFGLDRTTKPIFSQDYSFPIDNLSSSITSSLPINTTLSIQPSAADPSDPLYDPMIDVDTPARERISQFLILPPFRGTSHGMQLYTAMISLFLSDPSCFEITVEDPNEAFDDMRDYSDLSRLLNNAANPTALADSSLSAEFQKLAIDENSAKEAALKLPKLQQNNVPLESIADMRLWNRVHKASKIHHRQFDRLVEMHLLTSIPPSHRSTSRITYKHNAAQAEDRKYYFWRCLVRERLRIHNRDSLIEFDKAEREERLNDAVSSVQKDYERLLQGVRRREEKATTLAIEEAQAVVGAAETDKKRRINRVVMDDDDDDEAATGVENGDRDTDEVKRRKLEDTDGA